MIANGGKKMKNRVRMEDDFFPMLNFIATNTILFAVAIGLLSNLFSSFFNNPIIDLSFSHDLHILFVFLNSSLLS